MEQTWIMDEEGKFCCPYNQGCHCDAPACHGCGWNPAVARQRTWKAIHNYRLRITN